jgi:sulfur carrier protein
MNTIIIRLNGEPRAVPAGTTLADLLATMALLPPALATAVNGEFVARDARAGHVLGQRDSVVTLQPITGG